MLIDEFLPRYDANEIHETIVRAPIDRVYPFVRTLDLRRSFLSPVFSLVARPKGSARSGKDGRGGLSLQTFLDHGFILLAERQPEEVVIGLVERVGFGERVRRIRADEFQTFSEPGFGKAAWNFSLQPVDGGRTKLSTETRVLCLDPTSRRRFMVYWAVIQVFSGLIRMEFLRAIKKAAETPGTEPPPG